MSSRTGRRGHCSDRGRHPQGRARPDSKPPVFPHSTAVACYKPLPPPSPTPAALECPAKARRASRLKCYFSDGSTRLRVIAIRPSRLHVRKSSLNEFGATQVHRRLRKLVNNSSTKIGCFRAVFRVSENGKATEPKGCRRLKCKLTR